MGKEIPGPGKFEFLFLFKSCGVDFSEIVSLIDFDKPISRPYCATYSGYTEELDKDVSNRVLPVFEPPKPDMMQSIKDLFDLMADGFKLPKLVEEVKRSFISTGCVPIDESNNLDPKFKEYSKHKICGTMKIAPSGTSFPTDTSNTDISVNETHQYTMPIDYVLEYDKKEKNILVKTFRSMSEFKI